MAAGEPAPDYDLATSPQRHQILARAVEAEQGRAVPVTLYHWCPPIVRVVTTVTLPPALFSAIKDFTPLGTFFLPDDIDLAKTLSEAIKATSLNSELTPQILADVISRLDVPDQGTFLQFFSFPVSGSDPNEFLSDCLLPAWKWVKPDGIYSKTGFWEAELQEALEHGEWNGGKNLILLARGVSEEALHTATAGGRKTTSFERFLRDDI